MKTVRSIASSRSREGVLGCTGLRDDSFTLVPNGGSDKSSIQCPLGATTGCFSTLDLTADGDVDTVFDLPTDGSYKLLPGVLHGYRVSPADLGNYVVPSKRETHDVDESDDDD